MRRHQHLGETPCADCIMAHSLDLIARRWGGEAGKCRGCNRRMIPRDKARSQEHARTEMGDPDLVMHEARGLCRECYELERRRSMGHKEIHARCRQCKRPMRKPGQAPTGHYEGTVERFSPRSVYCLECHDVVVGADDKRVGSRFIPPDECVACERPMRTEGNRKPGDGCVTHKAHGFCQGCYRRRNLVTHIPNGASEICIDCGRSMNPGVAGYVQYRASGRCIECHARWLQEAKKSCPRCGRHPIIPKHGLCKSCVDESVEQDRPAIPASCKTCRRPMRHKTAVPIEDGRIEYGRNGQCVDCAGLPRTVLDDDERTAQIRAGLADYVLDRRRRGVPEWGIDLDNELTNMALGKSPISLAFVSSDAGGMR